IMRATDGSRDANTVAEMVLADESAGLRNVAEVFAVMARLADYHRLVWRGGGAGWGIPPRRGLRGRLGRGPHAHGAAAATRAPAERTAARDELAGTAGAPDGVAAAMAGLEATFTRLAGVPPTRRAGEVYGGRTVAYEECLRADTVRLGTDTLDGIRE